MRTLEATYARHMRQLLPKACWDSPLEEIISLAAETGAVIMPIECLVTQRRMRYFGHAERLPEMTIQHRLLRSHIETHGESRRKLATGIRYAAAAGYKALTGAPLLYPIRRIY